VQSKQQHQPPKGETQNEFRSGYVALIGRPNAGKSTLLNYLVGEKIAAVSNKPQTTRHRIQGIVTRKEGQIVFVDTPGVHKPGYLLNRRMMAAVHDAILSETMSGARKFCPTKLLRLSPSWSFLRLMIAVCGIGRPSG